MRHAVVLIGAAALAVSATPALAQGRAGLTVSARVAAMPFAPLQATIAQWVTDWYEGAASPHRGCIHQDAVVARGTVVVTVLTGETPEGRCALVVTRSVLGN